MGFLPSQLSITLQALRNYTLVAGFSMHPYFCEAIFTIKTSCITREHVSSYLGMRKVCNGQAAILFTVILAKPMTAASTSGVLSSHSSHCKNDSEEKGELGTPTTAWVTPETSKPSTGFL